jgi:hypothetical protein
MTGTPHPYTMAIATAQGHADLMAEVYRERLVLQAESRGEHGRRWTAQAAVMVIVVVLALVLAASGAVA